MPIISSALEVKGDNMCSLNSQKNVSIAVATVYTSEMPFIVKREIEYVSTVFFARQKISLPDFFLTLIIEVSATQYLEYGINLTH